MKNLRTDITQAIIRDITETKRAQDIEQLPVKAKMGRGWVRE